MSEKLKGGQILVTSLSIMEDIKRRGLPVSALSEDFVLDGRAGSGGDKVLLRGVRSGWVWDVPLPWVRQVVGRPSKKRIE